MKIQALKSVAGYFAGESFSFQPGQIVTVPDLLAKDLINAGHAKGFNKPTPKKPVTKRKRVTANG